MQSVIIRRTAALGLAGALVIGFASPSVSAPVTTSTATVKTAISSDVNDVRWRGRRGGFRRGGGGVAAGVAAGLIFGGLAAAAASRQHYYGPGYYDDGPVYYYEPAPIYVEPPPVVYYAPRLDPNGAKRQCWVATDKDRGFGYWRAC